MEEQEKKERKDAPRTNSVRGLEADEIAPSSRHSDRTTSIAAKSAMDKDKQIERDE